MLTHLSTTKAIVPEPARSKFSNLNNEPVAHLPIEYDMKIVTGIRRRAITITLGLHIFRLALRNYKSLGKAIRVMMTIRAMRRKRGLRIRAGLRPAPTGIDSDMAYLSQPTMRAIRKAIASDKPRNIQARVRPLSCAALISLSEMVTSPSKST